ncbi:MAG: HAD family phosphatase [Anaerolineaceae bacterium]|nr:HAD family phosphatase [Anaerolineaceae bacterium]
MLLNQFCILWDMDGTIVDNKDLHYETWHQTLLNINVNLQRKVFDDNFGKNNLESLPIYLGYEPDNDLIRQLSETKERTFQELAAQKSDLFPGVKNLLCYFQENKVPQAIASSAPMKNIEVVIEHLNLKSYFDLFVTGSDFPSKPAPDIFLFAANKLATPANRSIVIEDSRVGLQAGRSAGMKTIGVASTHPASSLEADFVLEDFNTPPEGIIRKLLGQ